jgi:FixJ family two-component response regulator
MTIVPLVVVIENDPSMLTALGRVLTAGGCEALLYDSAEAFLDAPPGRRPRCLLVDVHLGAMSGFDLKRRLFALGSNIPVIAMTALDDARVRAEARRAGCAGCLDKTSDVDEILALIRTL